MLGSLGNVHWKAEPATVMKRDDSVIVPDLVASLRSGKKEYTLFVEAKSSGEPRFIAELAGRMTPLRGMGYPVLVAPFISERGRELCKSLDIGCVDMAGNAYLKFNGIWIEKWGRENLRKEKRLLRRLFTVKATFVMRTMFSDLKRKWTMERLSGSSGASIGQVSKVVERLAGEDYVDKRRGSITLKNPGALLDAWTKAYDFGKNRSTGYFCDFRGRQDLFRRLKKIPPGDYALTLGAAASIVAPVVRSTDVYIYARADRSRIIERLDLKPIEFGGNVHLVDPTDEGVFMHSQEKDGMTLVSNLQLYLDLYNYPMRGREQAEAVRKLMLG